MKLSTGIIAHYLSATPEFICGYPDHKLILSDVRFFLNGKERYSEDILYFTVWDRLKEERINLPSYMFCVGGGSEAAGFFETNGLTGIIVGDNDPVFLFDEIQSVFTKFNRLEDNLKTALEHKAPTREILNCCSDFFENHTALYDTERNLIDYSEHYLPGSDDLIWKETVDSRKRSETMQAEIKKSGVQPKTVKTLDSELLDLGPAFPRLMSHSFFENRNRLATLMIAEKNKPLSVYQLKLLEYICEFLTPDQFIKDPSSSGLTDNLRSVFTSIMDNAMMDPVIARKYLSSGGWNVRDNYRLIRINLPPESNNSATMTRYRYTYERIFPECVAFSYVDSLVLIVHNDTDEVMSECMPKLEKLLAGHNAVCGVSLPFNNVFQLKSQYNYAEPAISLGDKDKRIRYLKDVLSGYIVGRVSAVMPLIPICHREALRLYDYDMENETELLLTLETYLKKNKSLKATAEELFIHRSTITYRLGCIENLTKMNLDDSEERMHIMLSCMTLRILDSVGAYKGM